MDRAKELEVATLIRDTLLKEGPVGFDISAIGRPPGKSPRFTIGYMGSRFVVVVHDASGSGKETPELKGPSPEEVKALEPVQPAAAPADPED